MLIKVNFNPIKIFVIAAFILLTAGNVLATLDTTDLTLRWVQCYGGPYTEGDAGRIGMWERAGHTYVLETHMYGVISSDLDNGTVNSVKLEFNVTTDGAPSNATVNLYEQNKSTVTSGAVFTDFGTWEATTAWNNNLNSNSSVDGTGKKEIATSSAFETLVEAWMGGTKTNYGLILSLGSPTHASYYIYFDNAKLIVDYTEAVNNLPTGDDDAVTFLEDNTATTFQTTDFTYSDGDSDPFDGILIKSLETAGDLEYSSVDVVDETYYSTMTNLIFKPVADANGTPYATFTHQVYDGTDYSTAGPYTMTINITAVNDEPSFTKGADQTVDENCGAKSIPAWATSLDKGATNESSQTLIFTVTNDNNSLFSSQPAVSSTGTLTYTPTADTSGTTVCTIYLKDDGGTANSGDDQSPDQTFNITVNEVENLADWGSSMKIYINTTAPGANVASTVSNFPLLIRLDPSNFSYFVDTEADGGDIRFSQSDGTTKLSYEIERWLDGASDNDTAVIWVKTGVTGNSSDQYIMMYWNKSGATTTSSSSGVFETTNDFAAVWHLEEEQASTGTADVYEDATSNNNHGDDYVSATLQLGVAKYGQEFDGTDDYITVPQNASLDITGDATISGWFRLDANFNSSSSASQIILEKYSSLTNNMMIGFTGTDYDYPLVDDGSLVFKIEDTDDFRFINTTTTSWTADTWYYFTILIDADTPASNKVYINGVDVTD